MKKSLLLLVFLTSYNSFIIGMDLATTTVMDYARKASPQRSEFLNYIKNPYNDVISDRFPYLCEAAMCNDIEVVKILLKRPEVDVDSLKQMKRLKLNGHTALGYACVNSDLDVILSLLQAGADLNVRTSTGYTHLHYAIFHGRSTVVELLLRQKNIDPNIKDNSGETPLLEVARLSGPLFCNFPLINLLLDCEKVDRNIKNEGNQSFFYVAYANGLFKYNKIKSLNFFKRFNKYERDCFLEEELRNLTRHFENGRHHDDKSIDSFIRFCIKNGADINTENYEDISPLESAYDEFIRLDGHVAPDNRALILKRNIFRLFLLHVPSTEDCWLEYHKALCRSEDVKLQRNKIKGLHERRKQKQTLHKYYSEI